MKTENEAKHTPTPELWHVGPYYDCDVHSEHGRICICEPFQSEIGRKRALQIVDEHNSHAALTARVKELEEALGNAPDPICDGSSKLELDNWFADYELWFKERARAALAKAGG